MEEFDDEILLNVGDDAPPFVGTNQNGEVVNLTDFKGKKVVLYFYPKDNTPGCTMQACSLRDNWDELTENNCVVIGVSADSVASHKKFVDKQKLNFILIADTEKEILKKYNAWGLKKFMGKSYQGIYRKTFIIDEEQKIIHIIAKAKTKNHAQEVIELIKN